MKAAPLFALGRRRYLERVGTPGDFGFWRRFGCVCAVACLLSLQPGPLRAQPSSARPAPRAESTRSDSALLGRFGLEVPAALLRQPEPDERQRGFERLGQIGTTPALELLIRAFDANGAAHSARDRLIAVRALAPHARVPAVRELLLRVLVGVGNTADRSDGTDLAIESAAALALARAGDEQAYLALGKALRQPGPVADTARAALEAFPPADLSGLLSVRGGATRALAGLFGALGDARGIPALRDMVRSATPEVRAEAALSLATLGVDETLELARHWLTEPNPVLLAAAARILVQRRAPDAARAVGRLLSLPELADQGLALAAQGSFPELTSELSEHARRAAGPERALAFRALGQAGGAEAARLLEQQLGVPQAESFAAHALALAPGSDADAALERALQRPASRRAALRAAVVRALTFGKSPPGVAAAIDALAGTHSSLDASIAAWARVALDPSTTQQALAHASPDTVRAIARNALLPGVARALLARLTLEPSRELREALAAGLVSLPAAEGVPTEALLELLDARGPAAPLAVRALAARDSHALRPRIEALLDNPDPVLRAHAALGLAESQDASCVGLLGRAYRFETEPLVRYAIVSALALRNEPGRRPILELVRSLDGSAKVRDLAALALAGIRPRAPGGGSSSAWLALSVPGGVTPSALLVSSEGLALPCFPDADGVLVALGLGPGDFELRLATLGHRD